MNGRLPGVRGEPGWGASVRGEFVSFCSLLLRAARASFAYKPALTLSLLSAGFAYLVPMLVWRHIYATSTRPLALPASELFPYLLVAGCLNFASAMNVEGRVGQRIRLGLIATDLLKPIDFQLAQAAQALGDGLFNLCLMAPLLGIAYLVWGNAASPHDALALCAFALSALLSLVILFAISFVFAQGAFVTYSGYGVFVARSAMQQAFSGLSAPLMLFPPGLRAVSEWLPFHHTIETPASIYLGWLKGDALVRALGAQLIWAVVLLWAGRALLRVTLPRFEVQGG